MPVTVIEHIRDELAGVADDEIKSITLTGYVWRRVLVVLESEDLYAEQDAQMNAEAERRSAEWESPAAVEQRRIERREQRKAYEARRKARTQS